MRALVILLGVAGLSTPSVGAESARYQILKKPADATEQLRPRSRCSKKIVLGAEKGVVACLMQKRKGVTETDHRANGSGRDEPARTR